jgi:hypothetical protein
MNLGDLTNRLQERIAKDREEMERIARSELQHLQQSLRESSSAALNTMASDIATQSQAARQRITASLSGLEQSTERWRNVLGMVLLRNTCIGLALTLGIGIGAWGLMTALSWRLESLQEETGQWKAQRDALKAQATALERKTWGIVLMEDRSGQYIVLPPGTKAQPYETRDKRQALRLE